MIKLSKICEIVIDLPAKIMAGLLIILVGLIKILKEMISFIIKDMPKILKETIKGVDKNESLDKNTP